MKLTARQEEIYALSQQGMTLRAIGRQLGVDHGYVGKVLRRAKAKLEADESDGIRAALSDTRLDGMEAAYGWTKTEGHSVFWRNPAMEEKATQEDFLERLESAFENITPTKPAPAPERVAADRLNVVPVPDAHIGMHSWGKETGEDYDVKLAAQRVVGGVNAVLEGLPCAEVALLLFLGDTNHAENDEARTPQSKHALDTDGRHYKVLDATIDIIAACIDLALLRHNRVIYRGLPGNHDPYTTIAITIALAQRYRNEPRVEIQKAPSAHFFMSWGDVLIAAHHGDGVKAERLVLNMADMCPDWRGGRDQHRHLFTGHLHHWKAQDIGGVQWEQLRAVCPKDAYASKHAYSAKAAMIGISFHKEDGETDRKQHIFKRTKIS